MDTMTAGYRSFMLLCDLHAQKALYLGGIAAGLMLGAALGQLIIQAS